MLNLFNTLMAINPDTGDNYMVALYIILGLAGVGIIGAIVAMVFMRRK